MALCLLLLIATTERLYSSPGVGNSVQEAVKVSLVGLDSSGIDAGEAVPAEHMISKVSTILLGIVQVAEMTVLLEHPSDIFTSLGTGLI